MEAIADSHPLIRSSLRQVIARAVDEKGFTDRSGGLYRTDATAWAILALNGSHAESVLLDAARSHLAQDQGDDGRISVSSDHPQAFWPTPLAVLAWQGSSHHEKALTQAVKFLLYTTGHHWQKDAQDPIGHNPAIKGWPWIGQTHSWIEPTALSIIALGACGHGHHPRVVEGVQLLLDRQLPHGGWNYGNVAVFGRELRPAPESTGAALCALVGRVPREQVRTSLDYLIAQMKTARTPIALGWGLLGLQSWGAMPAEAPMKIIHCLSRQERYGAYDTASLCLLLLSLSAHGKFGRVGLGSMNCSLARGA